MRILIVDDSAMMRAMIKRVVGLSAIPVEEILEAGNGVEALAVLESTDIQVMFTDINMPVMNGTELLREIAPRRMAGARARDHLDRWFTCPAWPKLEVDCLEKPVTLEGSEMFSTKFSALLAHPASVTRRRGDRCPRDQLSRPPSDRRVGARSAAGRAGAVAEATVRFERRLHRTSCLMSELARTLFDASARTSGSRAVGRRLFDLVGEFSNMVCGRWLTRMVKGRHSTCASPSPRPQPAFDGAPAAW